MAAFCFVLFLKFIACIEALEPKSVNLALETVLEFNEKDNSADIKFLDNFQEFLDKVKKAVGNSKIKARKFGTEVHDLKFTDFLKSVINILQTYEDDDLEYVFAVFDDEIRKYHYKGCKFYELVKDGNVRRSVTKNLGYIKYQSASQLRRTLDKAYQAIKDAKFTESHNELLDYVNSLYKQKASGKLKAFLNKLKIYSSKSKRANLDLVKVIREGIRSTIFDHYSELTPNARRELKIKIASTWKELDGKVNRRLWTLDFTRKNIYNKIKSKPEQFKSEHTKTIMKKNSLNIKLENPEMSDGKFTQTTPIELKKETDLSNANYDKPKKRKSSHNKLYSFITLYPEGIILPDKKRLETESKFTARKSKRYTLWEDTIKHNKYKKDTKHKPKTKSFIRGDADKLIISDFDSVINVRTLVDNGGQNHKKNSGLISTARRHRWPKKITVSNPKRLTKFYRRNIPKDTSLSEEGMTTDEYTLKKTTMSEIDTDTSAKSEIKNNVFKTVNIPEKVKEELNTAQTPEVVLVTRFETLQFWNSTAAPTRTKPNTIVTRNSTTSTAKGKTNIAITTTSKTTAKTTTSKVLQTNFTNTNISPTDNKTNIGTVKPTTRAVTTVIVKNTIANQKKTKSPLKNITKHIPVSQPDENIDLGLNFDKDLNSILKRYNIKHKPVTRKHYDLDKILADSAKTDDTKMFSEVKGILDTTQGISDYNMTFNDDPLLDINSILDK